MVPTALQSSRGCCTIAPRVNLRRSLWHTRVPEHCRPRGSWQIPAMARSSRHAYPGLPSRTFASLHAPWCCSTMRAAPTRCGRCVRRPLPAERTPFVPRVELRLVRRIEPPFPTDASDTLAVWVPRRSSLAKRPSADTCTRRYALISVLDLVAARCTLSQPPDAPRTALADASQDLDMA